MALGTYDDLVTQVQSWAKRSDLATQMPDFVQLADGRIRALVRPSLLEETTTINAPLGASSITPATAMLEPLALWIVIDGNWQRLNQVEATELPYSPTPTAPYYFAVSGGNLIFPAALDRAYEFRLRSAPTYSISPTQQTNAVLAKYPDLYLFATLLEVATWSFDDDAAAKWEGRFREAIKRANRQEARMDRNIRLRTDVPRSSGGGYDIYRGF